MTQLVVFAVIAAICITESYALLFDDNFSNFACRKRNIECCPGYTCKSGFGIEPTCVKDNFICEDFFDWGSEHTAFTSQLSSVANNLETCTPSSRNRAIFGSKGCGKLAKCCRVKSGDGWWDQMFERKTGICVTSPSYNPCNSDQTKNCKCPTEHDDGWDWLLDLLKNAN
ncbi:uncharacterized protein LOC121391665 isoform X2 [Gigantopelta aegis]|uniref:uncharacterized protein LOC121391665 isoform X2 n=1 Tax=Gigantopelta aegis TaxID=1735272 RepID=UPI001B88751B|nr:uncharacterized protein LOC121391665 isoform X2 [Gigantopelta aegis]